MTESGNFIFLVVSFFTPFADNNCLAFAGAGCRYGIFNIDYPAVLSCLGGISVGHLLSVHTVFFNGFLINNELLLVGGKLVKVTDAITTGDTITIGTNVASTTLAAEIAALA